MTLCKDRAPRTPGPSPIPAHLPAVPPASPQPPRPTRLDPAGPTRQSEVSQQFRPKRSRFSAIQARQASSYNSLAAGRAGLFASQRRRASRSLTPRGVFPLTVACWGRRAAPRAERGRRPPSSVEATSSPRRCGRAAGGLGRSFCPALDPPDRRTSQTPQLINPRTADPALPQFPHLRGGGAHLGGGHMPHRALGGTRPARASLPPAFSRAPRGGLEDQTLPRPWLQGGPGACADSRLRCRPLLAAPT